MVTGSLIVKEKETLILKDRSANLPSELMNLLNCFGKRSQIGYTTRNRVTTISFKYGMVGVKRGILTLVVPFSVKPVSSRLDRCKDDCTSGASEFSCRHACRNLELGDGFGIRKHADCSKLRLVIIRPIQRKVIICRPLAINRQRTAS